mmetsp:Transcript_92605/g.200198  ORF Transcript_92605/g.200198 Transcript_92605/m.200198 type:complete len:130 (+) Transcript_92605:453-842(+)
MAIMNNNMEIAEMLFASKLVDINSVDRFGRNCLHILMNESHQVDIDSDILVFLLSNGIDVNKLDIYKRTPLFYLFMNFTEFDSLLPQNVSKGYKSFIGPYKSKTFAKKDPVELFTLLVQNKVEVLTTDI